MRFIFNLWSLCHQVFQFQIKLTLKLTDNFDDFNLSNNTGSLNLKCAKVLAWITYWYHPVSWNKHTSTFIRLGHLIFYHKNSEKITYGSQFICQSQNLHLIWKIWLSGYWDVGCIENTFDHQKWWLCSVFWGVQPAQWDRIVDFVQKLQ